MRSYSSSSSSSSSSLAVRIGILGASWIAPIAVVDPAKKIGDALVNVFAIAARDGVRAADFGKKHRIPRVFKSYQDLISDPDVDAVYIGLPNSHHCEWALKCIEAGKHVLLEKPLCNNEDEARRILMALEEKNASRKHSNLPSLILMEAFHYRYHPMFERILEIVGTELGRKDPLLPSYLAPYCATSSVLQNFIQPCFYPQSILPPLCLTISQTHLPMLFFSHYLAAEGIPREVNVSFCIPVFRGTDIRYQLDLGGGALMDTGCYAVNCARQILRVPRRGEDGKHRLQKLPSSSLSEARRMFRNSLSKPNSTEEDYTTSSPSSSSASHEEEEDIEVEWANAKLAYPNVDQDVTAKLVYHHHYPGSSSKHNNARKPERRVSEEAVSASTSSPSAVETVQQFFEQDSETIMEPDPMPSTALVTCSLFTIIPKIGLVVRQGSKVLKATNWVAPHMIHNSLTITNEETQLERTESFPTTFGSGSSTYEYQLRAFVHAIRNNDVSGVKTTARDGVKNMKVIDNIYRKLNLPLRGKQPKP